MPERAEAEAVVPESLVWPLVGRAAELERIARLRAAEGSRGVVLTAAAGVGKSRLARDAIAAAKQDGAAVTWISATRSAAAVPLGAFAGLMPPDARSDDTLELMRRSAEVLRERAEGRRAVLGVDDAQLLDPTSAALVLHLTETGSAFVLATLRADEPCPDAVQSLWKDAGAVRLDLQTLGEEETGALVEAVLRDPVEERARRWIFEGSQGNVLYIRELVIGALADGALTNAGGFWRLTRRPPPSRSLAELVGTRLAGLETAELSALALLALGEPLRLSEMVELVGSDALAAVEARGLVHVDGPSARDSVRMAHPLYGEVVRANMPLTRAHEDRLRLAEVVSARADRTSDDALRIAHWLLDAGQPIPLELCLEASQAAILAGAVELGSRLASLALAEGGGAEAALLLARTHAIYKRFDEAEEVLASAEAAGLASQDSAIRYLEQRSLLLYWNLQRPEAALELLTRADGWWPDAAWKRRIEPMRLYFEWLNNSSSVTLEQTEAMLRDPELEPSIRDGLEIVHATNLFYGGRVHEACELARRVRPSVPLRTPTDEVAFDLCCVIPAEAGEGLGELEQYMVAMLEEGARVDDHAAVGIAAFNLGEQRTCEGRYLEAARLLAEAATQFERRDPFGYLPMVLGMLVGTAYYQGDLDGAERAMTRYRLALGEREIVPLHRPYHARIEATGRLAAGDAPGAQKVLIEAAEQCEDMPLFGIELRHHALRAGAPARRLVEAATRLGKRCESRLTTAYIDHIAGCAAGDGAALMRTTDEFADIPTTRYAAECAAHAAEVFAAEGRQDSARRAAARCRELHALGNGGLLPEMRGIEAGSVVLSPREAQLVELAARGLTNAEIADRLVLSVRTVESHIYRAMQKLGVNDRRDLPQHVA